MSHTAPASSSPVTAPPSEVRRAWLALLAVTCLHGLGLLFLIDNPLAALGGRPIVNHDWGLHHHHLTTVAALREQDGRWWGYDPRYMAGYPVATIQDASIKLFELLAIGTPFVSPTAAFNGWVLLLTAAVPALCYLGFWNLFGPEPAVHRGAVVAAVLGTGYWWNSMPREMFGFGMIGFPLASWFGIVVLSLLRRWLRSSRAAAHPGSSGRASWLLWCAWTAGCAVLLPLHLLIAPLLVLPGAVLLLAHWRHPRLVLQASFGVVVAVAVNGFWLVPFASHWGDDASAAIVGQLPLFVSRDPWTFLRDLVGGTGYFTMRPWPALEKVLRATLLVAGLWGLRCLWQRRERVLLAALASALGSLFLLTYFGSLFESLVRLQPLRFQVPLAATLVLCAAYPFGVSPRPSPRSSGRLAVALAVALGLAVVQVIRTEAGDWFRLQTELTGPAPRVVEWLQTRAPAPGVGRVLFEESGDETGFVYGETYLSALVPGLTGHSLIGGPINLYNDRHHFAEFHSGRLLGRDIASFGDAELRDVLELYNVTAMVVFHPATKARLFALTDWIVPGENIDGVLTLLVNQRPSWVLAGEATVRAGLNRIHCTDVRGDDLVLKFHWIEGLVGEPEVTIEPIFLLEDPIPFLRILDPPPSFALSVGGAGS